MVGRNHAEKHYPTFRHHQADKAFVKHFNRFAEQSYYDPKRALETSFVKHAHRLKGISGAPWRLVLASKFKSHTLESDIMAILKFNDLVR